MSSWIYCVLLKRINQITNIINLDLLSQTSWRQRMFGGSTKLCCRIGQSKPVLK